MDYYSSMAKAFSWKRSPPSWWNPCYRVKWGPNVVLTFKKEGSSGTFERDIWATGRLLRFIWTTRSRVPNDKELDLLSRMDREERPITASEAFNHFSLWSRFCAFPQRWVTSWQMQMQQISAVEKGRRSVIDTQQFLDPGTGSYPPGQSFRPLLSLIFWGLLETFNLTTSTPLSPMSTLLISMFWVLQWHNWKLAQ